MNRESIYKRYEQAVTPKNEIVDKIYWLAFCVNKMLVKVDKDNLSIPYLNNLQEINILPVRTQYLGLLHGCPCFSAELSSDTIAPEGMSLTDLRSLHGALDEDLFLLAGKAFQIVS
ncbi:MAG TPA: NUDIX-like domain-containing protein, partial [Ruminiclostridium sp.]